MADEQHRGVVLLWLTLIFLTLHLIEDIILVPLYSLQTPTRRTMLLEGRNVLGYETGIQHKMYKVSSPKSTWGINYITYIKASC